MDCSDRLNCEWYCTTYAQRIAKLFIEDFIQISYASVTLHRIALTDVQRITKFSIRPCPFACVSFPFIMRRLRFLSGDVRRCSFRSVESFEHVKLAVRCTVTMCWYAFCSLLVCSLFCTCPVWIRSFPVDLIYGRTTNGHAADVRKLNGRLRFFSSSWAACTFCAVQIRN